MHQTFLGKATLMSFTQIFQNKTFIFATCFIVLALAIFWSDRYPALLNKADVMGHIELQDRLSPDAGFSANSADKSFAQRTITTFGNWAYTNKKGMTFGLIFGAAVLTLMGFMRSSKFGDNPYINALKGTVAGTPLGVCSNCVSPIARGFFKSGTPATFALAVMFASPTFNIIVISMTFSAFPPIVGLIKITANLLLILVVVPLLYKLFMKDQIVEQQASCDIQEDDNTLKGLKPHEAGILFLRRYMSNLWFIVSRTLPLMVIGGILGAILAQTIPLESITTESSILGIATLSLITTFMPVPMTFDVLTSQILYSAGTSLPIVLTVLTTMGTFSILSCLIVWQSVGTKMAVALFMSVAFLGFLSGLAGMLLV